MASDQLPYSEEAEEALVARLLVEPAQIAVLDLDPADFYVGAWRRTYGAMLDISHRGGVVDLTTVTDEMGEQPPVDVLRLTAAHRAPLEEYAAIIKRDSFRRRLIGAMESVTRRAYEEEDRNVLLSALQEATSSVLQGAEDGRLLSPTQAVDSYLEVLDRRAAGELTGLTWGFVPIDGILQPAQGGEMVVLAARPSVGKTAMAEQIADHWTLEAGKPVLFVSLEMSLSQLLDRSMARHFGQKIKGRVGMHDLRPAAEERKGVHVWYLDDAFATTSSVRAAAARVRMMAGSLGGIVIDYISLLKDPGDSEVQRVTRISRNVKAIAREFDVPVLALSQLNRAVMQREDQHPQLHDLRESGAVEQDADIVIGLYRKLGTPDLDVEVLKNRHGSVGRVQMYFDPEAMRMA